MPLDLLRTRDGEPEGDFTRFEIPGLLLNPARHKRTGLLTLRTNDGIRGIGYKAGVPVLASSNVRSEQVGRRLFGPRDPHPHATQRGQ